MHCVPRAGAKIPDVYANQLASLNSTVQLVTLSIGGNDAGFSPVVSNCNLIFSEQKDCQAAHTEEREQLSFRGHRSERACRPFRVSRDSG